MALDNTSRRSRRAILFGALGVVAASAAAAVGRAAPASAAPARTGVYRIADQDTASMGVNRYSDSGAGVALQGVASRTATVKSRRSALPRLLSLRRTALAVSLLAAVVGSGVVSLPASASQFVWRRDLPQFGGNALAADESGEYTGGVATVTKWSFDGDPLWATTLTVSHGDVVITGLAADDSGLYVAGGTTGTFPGQPVPHQTEDVFVAHLMPDGRVVWATQFEVPSTPHGDVLAMVALAPDAVYTGGTDSTAGFLAALHRDGTLRWNRRIDPLNRAFAAGADGVAIGGEYLSQPDPEVPPAAINVVEAYRPNGSLRWTGWMSTEPTALASDGAGGYYTNDLTYFHTRAGGLAQDVVHLDADGHLHGRRHVVEQSEGTDGSIVGLTRYRGQVFVDWETHGVSDSNWVFHYGWRAFSDGLQPEWSRSFTPPTGESVQAFAANAHGGYAFFYAYYGAGPSALVKLSLDVDPPVADWRAARIPPYFLIPDDRVLTELAYSGRDDFSGVDHYALQRSVGGKPWTTVKLADPRQPQQLVDETPGSSVSYRVHAVDRQGNWSAWTTSPDYRFGLDQDVDKGIDYVGSWKSTTAKVASGGGLTYSSTAGDTATYSFSGDAFTFVSIVGPDRGQATVTVDGGKPVAIDLHAESVAGPFAAYGQSWTSVGKHTVTIEVLGTAGHPRVDVDAFETRATQ